MPVPLGTQPEQAAEGGELDLVPEAAVEVGHPETGGRALEVAQRQLVTGHACTLQHRIGPGRDDLPPVPARGMPGAHLVEAVRGRVEVGPEKQPAVGHLAVEGGREVLRHGHQPRRQRLAGVAVAEVEIGLIERAGDAHQQPPAVGRQAHARPVLLLRRTKHERVVRRVGTEGVEVDGAMVGLLVRGDLAGRGIARIVEAGRVRQPGEIGGPGAGDAVREIGPRAHREHVEHALLAAVQREPVGQQPAIIARVEPVEGGGAGRVERVGVDDHAVVAPGPVPDVEDGLVLPSVPPLVEVPAVGRGRHAQRADGEQLVEPAADRLPRGHGEVAFGQRVLALGPLARIGVVAVLEPAVGVGDPLAVEHVDRVVDARGRVAGLSHPG